MDPRLKDFLLKNPYPGMCFLPMTAPDGTTRVTFFIQDTKKNLSALVGTLPVKITFTDEGPDLWIMRLDFYFTQTSTTVVDQTIYGQSERGVAYYETEFRPSIHRPELEQLLVQDILPVLMYDRYTDYMYSKSITFDDKRPLLRLLHANP